MKKVFFILLALVLAFSVGLIGCGGGEEEEEEEPEPIEIIVAGTIPAPDINPISGLWEDMCAEIEEESEGRVKFSFYWNASLGYPDVIWDAVSDGTMHFTTYFVGTNPGLLPLAEISRLPMLGFDDVYCAEWVYEQIYETNSFFLGEVEGSGKVKFLAAQPLPVSALHMASKVVEVPDDLIGQRIAGESYILDLAAKAGATPMEVQVFLLGMQYQTGQIDGNLGLSYGIQDVFVDPELAPYHTDFGDAGVDITMQLMVFNQEKWDELPEDIQTMILDRVPQLTADQRDVGMQMEADKIAEYVASNHTFTYLTEEQLAEWAVLAQEVQDEWKAIGFNALAFNDIQNLIAAYPG